MSSGGHFVSARAGLEGKPDTVSDLADTPAVWGTPQSSSLELGSNLHSIDEQLQDPGHFVSSRAHGG